MYAQAIRNEKTTYDVQLIVTYIFGLRDSNAQYLESYKMYQNKH